jgi:hypothetical protein
MTKTRIFTRPAIKRLLNNGMTMKNVNFKIHSDGEYIITLNNNDIMKPGQAKATYMALYGLDIGYRIGIKEERNKNIKKKTKVAKHYKEKVKEVKELKKENEKILSTKHEITILKKQLLNKLENNPEKCKYYFMYLYINGIIAPGDRQEWADRLMKQIGNKTKTYILPLREVAEKLIETYWDKIWEYM